MIALPKLKTERLRLRPFTMKDADDVFAYANDEGWSDFQANIPEHYSREDVEKVVEMFSHPEYWENGHPGLPKGNNGAGLLVLLAIEYEGKAVGEICLNRRELDAPSDRVEIAYSLAKEHWNKGLMTEAAQALTDWAFREYGAHRVYAWCDPRNTGSWRVMEKIGMQREGLLRKHMKERGEYRDQLYYGVLREEWEG